MHVLERSPASLRQGRNPDPLTVLVMVMGALFILERRPRALAPTMFVCACNRESALFLGPLADAVVEVRRLVAVYGPLWLLASLAPTLVGCAVLILGYAANMHDSATANLVDAGPPPYPVR